jgi:hypothetical protein
MSFDIEFLKKNKYCIVKNLADNINRLDSIFDLIDKNWENPTARISRTTKEGYSVNEGPILPNILYVPNFNDKHIDDIKTFLIESKIKENLEDFWASNIGVCNVRAYRFTHDPPKEKTHYLEFLDKDNMQFNPHKDGLLAGTLKLMIFKSKNENKMTMEHGPLEIRPKNEWIAVTGISPIAIIFPPNLVLHRANRPFPNKIRDAIEITIIRRIPDDFLVESSGPQAGYPKNLRKWNKLI